MSFNLTTFAVFLKIKFMLKLMNNNLMIEMNSRRLWPGTDTRCHHWSWEFNKKNFSFESDLNDLFNFITLNSNY